MGKNNAAIGLDAILEQLGAFGKYNIVNYALLLFPIFLAAMYGSVYIFEAPDIQYRCNITECENNLNQSMWLEYAIPKEKGELARCTQYAPIDGAFHNNGTCTKESFNTTNIILCTSYVYSDEDSAVKDFNLACQEWKRTLIGTVHNSGLFISLPLTGFISDKYGRKLALAVAALMNGIFGFLRSFSTSYVMMLVFEFLEAGLGAGAYTTAFVLAIELVGPKYRVMGNTIINIVFVCGLMTLSGISWGLQDWKTMLKIIYSPALLVFLYLWILNESVRWLMSKGRHHEAAVILKKAAKMNKVELSEELLAPLYELDKITDPNTDIEKVNENTAMKDECEDKSSTSNLLKAFKSSIIRKRVCVCSFLWITCTFVFYGLSINSVSLAGNKYINFMLVAFVEIPANIMCLLVLDRFGRKRTLITSYVASACLFISLSLISKDQEILSLVLYLSGKFTITMAYSTVYIYVSEVFPTNVRQSLLAVCSSLGRVGSTLAPLTPLLRTYYDSLPSIFFGSLALVASVLVFTLPETINLALPDTIEEAEMLSKNKKQCS